MITDRRSPNRRCPTLLQAVNPIWWLSDAERNHNWSWIRWFLRNPACNFTMTIIGIADCFRDCHYAKSPWTYANKGWNWGYSQPVGSLTVYPFISHRGKSWEWNIGWKTSGGFSLAFRRAHSPNAEETP